MSLFEAIRMLPSYQRGQDKRELEQAKKLEEMRAASQLATQGKLNTMRIAEETAAEKRAQDAATNERMRKWSEDMAALTTTAEPEEIAPGVMRPNFVSAGMKMAQAKSAPYQTAANEYSRGAAEFPTTAEQGRTGGLAKIATNKNIATTADYDRSVTEGLDPRLAAIKGNKVNEGTIEKTFNDIARLRAERPGLEENTTALQGAETAAGKFKARELNAGMKLSLPEQNAATEGATGLMRQLTAEQQANILQQVPNFQQLNPAAQDAIISKILGIDMVDPVTKLPYKLTGKDPRQSPGLSLGSGVNQSAWGKILNQP